MVSLMSPAAVEESLSKLADLVSTFDGSRYVEKDYATECRCSVQDSQWLTGIRQLIATTGTAVTLLQQGYSVGLGVLTLLGQL